MSDLKKEIFEKILKPRILNNYALRFESAINKDGKYPDEWYWADKLAYKWGYSVKYDVEIFLCNIGIGINVMYSYSNDYSNRARWTLNNISINARY